MSTPCKRDYIVGYLKLSLAIISLITAGSAITAAGITLHFDNAMASVNKAHAEQVARLESSLNFEREINKLSLADLKDEFRILTREVRELTGQASHAARTAIDAADIVKVSSQEFKDNIWDVHLMVKMWGFVPKQNTP